MWWAPYAQRHHLPVDFGAPDGRSLTLEEVTALVGAASLGELRRGTRDPDPRNAGKPLSPSTLEGLLAALRWAHLSADRLWVGQTHADEIARLRKGYRSQHSTEAVPARPMAGQDIGSLFDAPPAGIAGSVLRGAAARALSVQASMSMLDAGKLTPEDVGIDDDGATVRCELDLPCTAVDSPDPLLSIVCAHCLLARWKDEAEPRSALIPQPMLEGARRGASSLANRLPGASFIDDILRAPEGAAARAGVVALCLPGPGVDWLVARAQVLPMRAVGLGFDDLVGSSGIQVEPDGVTITRGRQHRRSPVMIRPEGGPRCPVAALAAYDAWAGVFLPTRKAFLVALRGKSVRYPIETDTSQDSTGRYQWLSKWLRNQQPGQPRTGGGPARSTLTTRSARRGFARAAHQAGYDEFAIKRALGHARVETTRRNLRITPGGAGQVPNAIDTGRDDNER